MRYFLGADVGSTKTHVVIADEHGQALGFGQSGPGNHEIVGYDGLEKALEVAAQKALNMAGISTAQIAGAGFGVAGFDWPQEKELTLQAIRTLGLAAPVEAVNDALIGLIAGAREGWGVAVVSGSGCNCWGWDRTRQRQGQVTGASLRMGEGAGGSELVAKAIQMVAYEWTRRGPPTQLTPAFIKYTGAADLTDLVQGLAEWRISITAAAAPLVFQVAAAGDPVANEVLDWAGSELGELANAVIRQLEFESLTFDVVLVGSLYNGGPLLIEPMQRVVHQVAPSARLVRLAAPPAVGAVLLGFEQAGVLSTGSIRERLLNTIAALNSDQAANNPYPNAKELSNKQAAPGD